MDLGVSNTLINKEREVFGQSGASVGWHESKSGINSNCGRGEREEHILKSFLFIL